MASSGSGGTPPKSPPSGVHALQDDILVELFSCLTAADACPAAAVCRRWRAAVRTDTLWRTWCCEEWGVDVTDQQPERSFFETFRTLATGPLRKYRRLGGRVVKLWNALKHVLSVRTPATLATLQPGASEEELDLLEAAAGYPLPLEYRCWMRVHGAQKQPNWTENTIVPTLDGTQADVWQEETGMDYFPQGLGLFGSWSFYDEHCSLNLVHPTESLRIIGHLRPRAESSEECHWLSKCIVVGIDRRQLVLLALDDYRHPELGADFQRGELVYNGRGLSSAIWLGKSWLGFWREHVRRISDGTYDVRCGQVLLFPGCGGDTRSGPGGATQVCTAGVTVAASPLLIPHLSDARLDRYQYAYRLRFSLSPTAPQPVQLTERVWNGRDDPAQPAVPVTRGPGVVGHNPILQPGGPAWEYCSCTVATSRWHQMGGAMLFVPGSLSKPQGAVFEAEVAPFTCAYTPYGEAATADDEVADRGVAAAAMRTGPAWAPGAMVRDTSTGKLGRLESLHFIEGVWEVLVVSAAEPQERWRARGRQLQFVTPGS
eukprot:TRINITY_DN55494_c0_g1_i1.p1 TRINITY_DN55494_c0_g1~~TRINITY_DN55494_c0_g1_i1.p1  ORF type:complete len:543 (+),score=85.35 TRINITY_DN55494_c0_g1_i1:73-1701(+)